MPSVAETARLLSRYGDLLGLVALLPVLADLKFGALLRAQQAARDKRSSQAAEGTAKAKKDEKDNEKDKGKAKDKPQKGKADETGKDKEKSQSKAKAAEAKAAEAKATAGFAAAKQQQTQEETAKEAASNEEQASDVPPMWSLLLLILAEVIASMQLLDPADKQTRRAVGAMLRSQRSAQPGFTNALKTFEKLLEDDDVYELVRFAASFAGLGCLLLTTFLGAQSSDPLAAGAPLRVARRSLGKVVKALCVPQLWFVALLLAAFGLAQRAVLAKLIRKSAVVEVVRLSPCLWRALAAVGAAVGQSREGPMPKWAALQSAAAVARVAHVLVFERVSWSSIFDVHASRSASLATARCALALEGFGVFAMLPQICSHKRYVLLAMLLVLPCWVLLDGGGPLVAPLEPVLEQAGARCGLFVAVVALCLIFMGGFPTMISCVLLIQVLVRIHGLDKMKY